ncbi:MAG: hypothetical protein HN366_19750 [Deltaproteobacteria bacterium]|nr:hypothetical protein [Deltaproteobacteria bacterium]
MSNHSKTHRLFIKISGCLGGLDRSMQGAARPCSALKKTIFDHFRNKKHKGGCEDENEMETSTFDRYRDDVLRYFF